MFKINSNFNLQESTSCLIVGAFDNEINFRDELLEIDHSFSNELFKLKTSEQLDFKCKKINSLFTFGKIGAQRLIIVGLGKSENFSTELLRETLGRLFKFVKKQNVTEMTMQLKTFTTEQISEDVIANLIGEALGLATYELIDYKQRQSEEKDYTIDSVTFVTKLNNKEELINEANSGYVYAKATNSARSLVNLPGNMLTASELANYATQLAEKYNFEIEILNKVEMEELGMGAMLAVNKGSVEEPKMISLKHKGNSDNSDVIGLVGKGITFDTGGYSLKPKDGIVGMKSDMGGAAAVLGAMEIIGELNIKQNVIAVIPSTDNMISGEALKPDDVITAMNGKTIEVLNTDAEGRLVLADAVTYAKQQGANHLVDVATLTGGVVVALGTNITGAITNDEKLYSKLKVASELTDEPIWQLPLFEKDKKRVRNSKVADLNNSPGREGHAIMGGAFIGEFAEGTPWVHLDIAGTATTNSDYDLGVSGATGVMVRTLAKFVADF